MSIALRAPQHLPRLTERLRSRLERALEQVRHLVREARATIRDTRSPLGGVDQQASVALQLVDGTILFAEARATHPAAALAMAATRARRAALLRARALGLAPAP